MAAHFDPDEPAGFQRLRRRGGRYSRLKEMRGDAFQLSQSARRDAGCHKRAYPSKAEAETAIAHANAVGLHLRRAYRCDTCAEWHTTSQAFRRG